MGVEIVQKANSHSAYDTSPATPAAFTCGWGRIGREGVHRTGVGGGEARERGEVGEERWREGDGGEEKGVKNMKSGRGRVESPFPGGKKARKREKKRRGGGEAGGELKGKVFV